MTDTTAQILAKGCQATGITEELARKYHDNLGIKVMAIVELQATSRTEDTDGKESVKLHLLSVEPATDPGVSDHLRNLQRAMYHGRKLHSEDDQPQIDGIDDIEPTVKDVLAQGQAMLPDPPGDGGPDSPTCANCLHTLDHRGIRHEPEDGDEACTWGDCSHVVHADDTRCTKRECEQEQAAPVPG